MNYITFKKKLPAAGNLSVEQAAALCRGLFFSAAGRSFRLAPGHHFA
jgi:hypothetical protein